MDRERKRGMRLIFVRHPQTEANESKLIYGRLDAQYSDAGRASIPAILEALRGVKFDALIASPLSRTRYLAQAIAADHGFSEEEIRLDDRVIEMNFGIIEGMTAKEAKEQQKEAYDAFMADYERYVIPEGESCFLVYQRVGQFLKDIYEEFEGSEQRGKGSEQRAKRSEQTVVVVAHSMVIHTALSHLLKTALEEMWHMKIEPGAIVDLDWRCGFAMLQGLSGPLNIRETR